MSVVKLEECRERIRKELDNVVDFWLQYSHDTVHGYCTDICTHAVEMDVIVLNLGDNVSLHVIQFHCESVPPVQGLLHLPCKGWEGL